MSPHLTDAEIAEITNPLTQAAARCRYFKRELGITVTKKKPNGQPLISREDYAAALSSQRARRRAAAPAAQDTDWDAVRAYGGRKLRVV